jgi:hypothetical protein
MPACAARNEGPSLFFKDSFSSDENCDQAAAAAIQTASHMTELRALPA